MGWMPRDALCARLDLKIEMEMDPLTVRTDVQVYLPPNQTVIYGQADG